MDIITDILDAVKLTNRKWEICGIAVISRRLDSKDTDCPIGVIYNTHMGNAMSFDRWLTGYNFTSANDSAAYQYRAGAKHFNPFLHDRIRLELVGGWE